MFIGDSDMLEKRFGKGKFWFYPLSKLILCPLGSQYRISGLQEEIRSSYLGLGSESLRIYTYKV